jgi:hypothetical protein
MIIEDGVEGRIVLDREPKENQGGKRPVMPKEKKYPASSSRKVKLKTHSYSPSSGK